jgi:hypothetical protein
MDQDAPEDIYNALQLFSEHLKHAQPPHNKTKRNQRVFTVITLSMITSALELQTAPLRRICLMGGTNTGAMRMIRWLNHPNPQAMKSQLGLSPYIFKTLLYELKTHSGLQDSGWVAAEEKLGIFLYICRDSLGVIHTGETFQRSKDTISK